MMQAIYAEEKGYWVVHIIDEGHRFGMGSILFRVSKDGMLEGEKYLTHACMLLRRSKGEQTRHRRPQANSRSRQRPFYCPIRGLDVVCLPSIRWGQILV